MVLLLLYYVVCLSLFVLPSVSVASDFTPPSDVLSLPDGVTEERAQEITNKALKKLVSRLWNNNKKDDDSSKRRNLLRRKLENTNCTTEKFPYFECGSVIAAISATEIQELVRADFDLEGLERLVVEVTVIARLQSDYQIWKICGSCADPKYPGDLTCNEGDYGFDATVSGALFLPYTIWEKRAKPGTSVVTMLYPVSGDRITRDLESSFSTIAGAFTSASETAIIIPDQLGFGDSSAQSLDESKRFKRPFGIRDAIETGTAPLIAAAEKLVQEQTNGGCTALAKSYVVVGYSEGGFAGPAFADFLARQGKAVRLFTGGGVLKLSTEQASFAVENFRKPEGYSIGFTAYLGAAYSSTIPGLPNFEMGQDLLIEDIRQQVIDNWNRCGDGRGSGKTREPFDQFCDPDCKVNRTGAILGLNPDFIQLVDEALAEGDREPCKRTARVNELKVDKLCAALMENDLIESIEKADYPVRFCHSRKDELVSFENLPDATKMIDAEITEVGGSHGNAGVTCIVEKWVPFWLEGDINKIKVEKRHDRKKCDKYFGPVCRFWYHGRCWKMDWSFF